MTDSDRSDYGDSPSDNEKIIKLLKEISFTLLQMKQQEKDYWETWKKSKLGDNTQ
jgi:hypothetical protein